MIENTILLQMKITMTIQIVFLRLPRSKNQKKKRVKQNQKYKYEICCEKSNTRTVKRENNTYSSHPGYTKSLSINDGDVEFLGDTNLPAEIMEVHIPYDSFKYFFNDEVVDLIIEESNRYSDQNCPKRKTVENRPAPIYWYMFPDVCYANIKHSSSLGVNHGK